MFLTNFPVDKDLPREWLLTMCGYGAIKVESRENFRLVKQAHIVWLINYSYTMYNQQNEQWDL